MPYLLDISNWAKLFSGGNATPFTYELPYFDFSLYNFDVLIAKPNLAALTLGVVPIPIEFPIYAFGGVRIYADLSFGFDTFGIQKALTSKNPLDVIDGFYVNDWTLPDFRNGAFVPGTGGKEKPELGISVEIGPKAGVGVPGVAVGIGGSLKLQVDADLNDIKVGTVKRDADGEFIAVDYKGDGKVRASEMLAMMAYPGLIPGIPGGPLNMFDLKFTPYFNGYVWAKILVLDVNVPVFSLKLAEINVPGPTVVPVLGSLQGDTLYLNAGSRSGQRALPRHHRRRRGIHDQQQGRQRPDRHQRGRGRVQGLHPGIPRGHPHRRRPRAGQRQARCTRAEIGHLHRCGTAAPATTRSCWAPGGRAVDLEGNNAPRALATSTAPVILVGGRGKDTISGGQGDDILYGGAGYNEIDGGGGNDRLYALQGINKLTGATESTPTTSAGQLGINTLVENGRQSSDSRFHGRAAARAAVDRRAAAARTHSLGARKLRCCPRLSGRDPILRNPAGRRSQACGHRHRVDGHRSDPGRQRCGGHRQWCRYGCRHLHRNLVGPQRLLHRRGAGEFGVPGWRGISDADRQARPGTATPAPPSRPCWRRIRRRSRWTGIRYRRVTG
jgi:hypothetical protein